MHAFELKDGRALEAEIVDYDGRSGKVTLKRSDGKRVPVPTNIFIEKDQAYIRDWVSLNAFLSNTLSVNISDRTSKKWKEEQKTDVRYTDGTVEKDFIHNIIKYEEVVFDVEFNNQGGVSLDDLMIEYCVYYEQSTMVWEDKPEVKQKTYYAKLDVPELKVKVPVKISSKPVMIYEDDINPVPQLDGDQRRPGKGKIIGIRTRLRSKKGDGAVYRETCSPSTLSDKKYPWSTTMMPNRREAYRKK